MKKIFTFFFSLLCFTIVSAQWDALKPSDLVKEASQKGIVRKAAPLKQSHIRNASIPAELKDFTLLELDRSFYSSFESREALIELTIPSNYRNDLTLQLVEVDINNQGNVAIALPANREMNVKGGKHYRGIVKGNNKSVVALSVFEDEIMAIISGTGRANTVIGKLKDQDEHIMYEDADLSDIYEGVNCSTEDDGVGYTLDQLRDVKLPTRDENNCVKLYLEVDYDLYQKNSSSVDKTTQFAQGLMNQVMTLYANENIRTSLNPVVVWTQPSGLDGSQASTILTKWRSSRANAWEGTLGGLISTKASGGVAAGVKGICNSDRSLSMCFSSVYNSYQTVPTYSWSVDVVTHEFGHLFGSKHTHACVWNGNSTAIDGCAGYTEGNCSLPPNATPKGTIMSYCHNNVGKDLSLGFGSQPGNVIRNNVYNATCLGSDCSQGVDNSGSQSCIEAFEPNESKETAKYLSVNKSIQGSISSSTDKDYYLVDIRKGSLDITLDGPASKDYDLYLYDTSGTVISKGVSNSADEKISVASIEEGSYLVYVYGYSGSNSQECYTLDIVNDADVMCEAPQNFAVKDMTENSATFTFDLSQDASTYTIEAKRASVTDWKVLSSALSSNEVPVNGFDPGIKYDVRVKSNCATQSSEYTTISFTTPGTVIEEESCSKPASLNVSNVSQNTSSVSWDATSGASSYKLEVKLSSEPITWSVLGNDITRTSADLSGFQSGTSYDLRISSNCSNSTSDYTITSFTTLEDEVVVEENCATPSNLTASNVTENSVEIKWYASVDADSYKFEAKQSASSNWTVVRTATTSTGLELSSLLPNTSYDIRVSSNCSTLTSEYVRISFTTLEEITCSVPSGLNIDSITENSADISWIGNVDVDAYTLEYKKSSAQNWDVIEENILEENASISGLDSATSYDIRLKSNCPTRSSEYVLTSFVTLEEVIEVCDAPSNISISNVTDSSADISWDGSLDAITYTVVAKGMNTNSTSELQSTTTELSTTLRNLLPNTRYDLKINSNCSNLPSEQVILSFTTLEEVVDCKSAYENNHYFNTAALIPTNTTIQAALVKYDVDVYKVEVTEASDLKVKLEGIDGKRFKIYLGKRINSYYVRYYDNDISRNTYKELEANNAEPGVYYVWIKPYYYWKDYSDECYSLTVETNGTSAMPSLATEGLSVYPNPNNSGYLNIVTRMEDADYTISDLNGKVLIEGKLSQQQIDITDLQKGVYFVKVTDQLSLETYTEKLIIVE